MGKVTGFLEINREQPTRRKADERIRDWFEIYEPFPEEKQREQGARCMDCGVPFCHTGCPVNNLIPDWNDLVYNNRWEAAVRRLHSTNNFPEFTGRICPAPCEAACVLGINQPPVSIKLIERSIVERAWDEGWIHPEPPEQATGKRVAVVGSGPAGLAAAQQLRRAGHSVTVYEKNDRIGGLLRYGIPNFKLEKHIVDRRIEQMKAEGVDLPDQRARRRQRLRRIAHRRLRRHPALRRRRASARSAHPRPRAQGHSLRHGVSAAAESPQRRRRGRSAPRIMKAAGSILATGKRVVIIGGGDTGADCLGTSHRQGAKSVHQFEIMPKPPAERAASTPWPLWPLQLRTESSHEEGGIRDWSINTVKFTGDENGNVKQLHCCARRPSAQVRGPGRHRVHARRRSGSARHGLPRPGYAMA